MPDPTRGRAWRRRQNRLDPSGSPDPEALRRQKNWKLLYTRAVKLRRAQQLGLPWPARARSALFDEAP